MIQRSIFDDEKQHTQSSVHWEIAVDGASRNNPGQAAVGIVIKKNGQIYLEKGYSLGIKTNNEAEYLAFIIACLLLNEHAQHGDILTLASDSQLLINQLLGLYKVKHPGLKGLYALAKELISAYQYTIHHILRDQNKRADALANEALDKKIPLDPAIKHRLTTYEIYL